MTDTTFSDSYIATDAALETLIGSDPRASAVALKAAVAATQAWYCQAATKAIDRLPLRGRKYARDGTQALQFPREYMTPDGWFPDNDEEGSVEVPQQVIDACLEEAIAIYGAGAGGIQEIAAQGIQSFSVGGKLSYTFAPGAGSQGLQSSKAAQYLRRYLGGKIR